MAISSPLSSLTAAAKTTTKRTIGLARLLSRNIETKKNISTSIGLFKRRRRDISKRDALRDRLLAPVLVTRQGGARSLALADKSTSISDRLLGFIGYLSAGWILSNMPTWISLGTQFTSRLITAGNILSNYGDETIRAMNEIKNVFGAALENISRFDFTDSSYRVRSSLNDLKNEIDTLGVGLKEAFDVMLQPFKDVPPPGTIQPDKPTPTPTPPPSGGNADFWTLVAIVSREDGDAQGQADVAQSIYNRAKSGAYGSSNIRELILRQNQYEPTWQRPKPGKTGKPNPEWFQINDAKSAAKASGFSESTIKSVAANITNPTLQKNAAEFVQGRTDFKGANSRFPGGIQRKAGDNYFGWQYGYQGTSIASVPDFGLSPGTPPVARQKPTQPPITGQRRLQKGDVFTKSLGKDVSLITISDVVGTPRKGGRTHGGIDITAPSGTYIALRADAEWVAYAYEGGGYGHVLDLWIPSYGIQLRFAHLLEQPAKLSKIPAGRSFARVGSSGGSTGPHIHLEYDTKRGASRGGGARNDDPTNYAANLDQYVRLLLLTKNPNKGQFSSVTTTASLVPGAPSITTDTEDQVEMETNAYLEGLLNGITQERQGRKILIIDDRSMGGVQQVISSGGSGDLQIQMPDSVLLNNFIKNKLLLDLNYL